MIKTINRDIKILLAWKFVKLRKGTQVELLKVISYNISEVKLLKGKYKGRIIHIDSSVLK